MSKEAIVNEKAHIEQALKVLRPLFTPGTPDVEILAQVLRNGHGECTVENLAKFAKARKRFTTADAMQYFSCGKYKFTGPIAALVKKGVVEKVKTPSTNPFSTWRWVG